MVTYGSECMVMNHILMVIILMIGIGIIGCTDTPPEIPIPTPVVQPVLDERVMVMESLTQFNQTGNLYILILMGTNEIYELNDYMVSDTSRYHVSYVLSRMIGLSLNLYKDGITNWNPPEDSKYYDRLIEIKEAELYRIKHFGELNDMMLLTLPIENDKALEEVRQKFVEWKDDSRNQIPMNLQNEILKELSIEPDEIDFLYAVPDKPLPTLPPMPLDDQSPGTRG